MELWLKTAHANVQELVVVGFLEDLRNFASRQPFGKEAFVPFLGPNSREAWDDLERSSPLIDIPVRANPLTPHPFNNLGESLNISTDISPI
jgi:hypothetical protein